MISYKSVNKVRAAAIEKMFKNLIRFEFDDKTCKKITIKTPENTELVFEYSGYSLNLKESELEKVWLITYPTFLEDDTEIPITMSFDSEEERQEFISVKLPHSAQGKFTLEEKVK